MHALEQLTKERKEAAAKEPGAAKEAPAKTAHVQAIEDELRQKLATRVQIKLKGKDKGQVVIGFDTNDDFVRIVDAFRRAA